MVSTNKNWAFVTKFEIGLASSVPAGTRNSTVHTFNGTTIVYYICVLIGLEIKVRLLLCPEGCLLSHFRASTYQKPSFQRTADTTICLRSTITFLR